ncbi:alpha/beta hydrolase, partial [Virgibacillus halodenitrificans]|nr:alpha/beta hydrolase [Virgibacillus halodenitrificans]
MTKKKKRWLQAGISLITILLIIDVIAGVYFYNLAIERNVKDFLVGNSDLEVSAEAMDVFTEGDWRDWVRDQEFEQMEMTSYDGLKLKGYFLKA